MKNLSSFEAFKLNKVQMNAIAGGTSIAMFQTQLRKLTLKQQLWTKHKQARIELLVKLRHAKNWQKLKVKSF